MRARRALAFLVQSALLLACTQAAPPQPPAPRPKAAAPRAAEAHCAFRGVVRAEGSEPVARAVVAAVPPRADEPVAVAVTDGEGRYCFESLPAGRYGFTVTAPTHTGTYVDVRDTAAASREGPRPAGADLDIDVGGPGFTLRGKAAAEGAPLADSQVLVARRSAFEADIFVARTDAEGRYDVKLPAGDYVVLIRNDTHFSPPLGVKLSRDEVLDVAMTRVNPKDRPAADEVVAWIGQKAVRLATVEAGKGLDDMEPLQAVIGGARVVGLGEATHGGSEFFKLKHRMLEFLVTKMGFRVFGIEASLGDCLPLTEYVATGKGDPAEALANQGQWAWDTEEVLALVKWMRRYNEGKAAADRVSFWGYDMQSPARSTQDLVAYFQKVDPPFAKELGRVLEPFDDDFTVREAAAISENAAVDAGALARTASQRLEDHQNEYIKNTNASDYHLARAHAEVVASFTLERTMKGGPGVRDRAMADVAERLLDLHGPGSKMVVWAHNGHVTEASYGGQPAMGMYLKDRLKDAYFSFGLAFDEGSFQAIDFGPEGRGLLPFTVPSAPPGSLDHTLARAGAPLFALDLRGAPEGPVRSWLTAASFTRSVGAVFDARYPDHWLMPLVPVEHYDALLFVQKTTAAHPNATGKRGGGGAPKKEGGSTAPPDLGFEDAKVGELPARWGVTSMPKHLVYRAAVTDKGCAAGKRCLVLDRAKGDVPTGVGTAGVSVDATPHRGRKAHISASVRVEGKGLGDEAFLMAFTRSAKPELMNPKMAIAPAAGASWKKVEVQIDVPPGAEKIVVALAVTGAAKAGLDDIEVKAGNTDP